MITEKQCTKCKIVKPISEFYNMKAHKDGHFPICKVCINKMNLEYRQNNKENNIGNNAKEFESQGLTRQCVECKQIKPLSNFNIRRSDKYGHDIYCKECASKLKRAKHHEHKSLPLDEYTNWRLKENSIRKDEKLRLKTEVFSHYCSNGIIKCANPYGVHKEEMTDLDILSLDHINGDGYKDRDIYGHRIGGHIFYRKLKLQSYPNGFQVLCGSCQMKKKIVNKENYNPANVIKKI